MASTVCIMKCGNKDIKTLLFSPPPSFPSALSPLLPKSILYIGGQINMQVAYTFV